MSEYQEEVLTNLLDLQAELRGDEPEPHDGADERSAEASAATPGTEEDFLVTEKGLTISLTSPPKRVGVDERLAALNERLARLEYDLAGVTRRIERIEPDPELIPTGDADADVDARWRSFLDLQKIVANRLDQR